MEYNAAGAQGSPHEHAMHPASTHASVLARTTLARAALPVAPCSGCMVGHLCLGAACRQAPEAFEGLMIGRRRLRKGQKLYREGEPFEYVYALRLGTLKSTMTLNDGRDHVNSFYLAGDVVGFDGMARGSMPTTVRALENADVCTIAYSRLSEGCATSPPLRERVSQLMGLNIVREYHSTGLVRRRLTEKRVAGFLMELSDQMEQRGYSGRRFELRMSRAEIGSYLGTSLETVSRAFSEFHRQGLIRVHSRSVELLQAHELRELAEDPAQA